MEACKSQSYHCMMSLTRSESSQSYREWTHKGHACVESSETAARQTGSNKQRVEHASSMNKSYAKLHANHGMMR
eukprot:364265-Chlamydomonas_euryale.AAC.12